MVEGLGRGIVALGGQWQFHLGDDAEWSLPNLDDTGWERLLVDRPWGDQGHYGYTGLRVISSASRFRTKHCIACRARALHARSPEAGSVSYTNLDGSLGFGFLGG